MVAAGRLLSSKHGCSCSVTWRKRWLRFTLWVAECHALRVMENRYVGGSPYSVNTPKCEERGFGVKVHLLPVVWCRLHDIPLFQLSQAPKFPWFFIGCCLWNLLLLKFTAFDMEEYFFQSEWACMMRMLIAQGWPRSAEIFSPAEFQLLVAMVVRKEENKIGQLSPSPLICSFWRDCCLFFFAI